MCVVQHATLRWVIARSDGLAIVNGAFLAGRGQQYERGSVEAGQGKSIPDQSLNGSERTQPEPQLFGRRGRWELPEDIRRLRESV